MTFSKIASQCGQEVGHTTRRISSHESDQGGGGADEDVGAHLAGCDVVVVGVQYCLLGQWIDVGDEEEQY